MSVLNLVQAQGSPCVLSATLTPVIMVSDSANPTPTNPVVTLRGNAGSVMLIRSRVAVDLVGATYASPQTLTLELYDSTDNGVVLGSVTVYNLAVCTTLTGTLAVIELPDVRFTRGHYAQTLQLRAGLSALPSAGSVQVREASITVEM
jgi:hypothetical protein